MGGFLLTTNGINLFYTLFVHVYVLKLKKMGPDLRNFGNNAKSSPSALCSLDSTHGGLKSKYGGKALIMGFLRPFSTSFGVLHALLEARVCNSFLQVSFPHCVCISCRTHNAKINAVASTTQALAIFITIFL